MKDLTNEELLKMLSETRKEYYGCTCQYRCPYCEHLPGKIAEIEAELKERGLLE